jgi:hypothetical protein
MKKAMKATPMVIVPSRMTSGSQYTTKDVIILQSTYKANAMPTIQDVLAYHQEFLQR